MKTIIAIAVFVAFMVIGTMAGLGERPATSTWEDNPDNEPWLVEEMSDAQWEQLVEDELFHGDGLDIPRLAPVTP